jgi:hypothetical protein
MKASAFFKIYMILPLILFVDYLLMALIGCTTCLFGLGENLYCGSFCLAGKIIPALSIIFFGYIVYPDIMAISKLKKYGASA